MFAASRVLRVVRFCALYKWQLASSANACRLMSLVLVSSLCFAAQVERIDWLLYSERCVRISIYNETSVLLIARKTIRPRTANKWTLCKIQQTQSTVGSYELLERICGEQWQMEVTLMTAGDTTRGDGWTNRNSLR